MLVEVRTGERRAITPERRSVRSPRWSPEGDALAFIDAAEEDRAQVFVLPMQGGEARRVTEAETGVSFFRWSPDGQSFVFGARDQAEEKEGDEKHNRSFEVGNNSYLTQAAPLPIHLWRIPIDGGEAERLTRGQESVEGFELAPDGRSIAMTVRPRPHTGEGIRSFVRILDPASKETRVLVPGPAVDAGSFSSDGTALAIAKPRGPEPGFNPSGVFVIPPGGGELRDVSGDIDRHLRGGSWLPDGSGLLLTAPDLTRISMWHQPLEGPPRKLDLGHVDPASGVVISEGGTVAFIGREPHRPGELYLMDSWEDTPRRVTGFNDELASVRMGRVETVTWDGPDEFEENGVLVYPPDFQEGETYPLVLVIHRGPMGTSTESFNAFDQILAAKGWLVFKPNYRGSNNQGSAFQRAVINDAGDGPGRDVMSGVEVLKDRGVVNEKGIVASGWSYGGYMTVWLTSHYDGWAAAVAGAAVTDWFDWYNMADMNTWAGFGLGGSPWLNDNAENYWRQSPMAYAHRIRTPTLILSNTGDERVTVSQSYKLYHALEDNGVEVKFIAYPIPGHFPGDPVHQRDVRRRWIEWIEQHLKVSG